MRFRERAWRLPVMSYRTIQDIEQQLSEGTVQTMNRIFGMLGLKLAVALGVCRAWGAEGENRPQRSEFFPGFAAP